MAICSASTKDACLFVLDNLLGKENLDKFDLILAGDDVPRRKPDPMIYTLASERLAVPAERWVGRGRTGSSFEPVPVIAGVFCFC